MTDPRITLTPAAVKAAADVPGDPDFVARETAFNDWRSNVILGPLDNHGEDVAHEAFCSGWEAATPPERAANLQRAIDRVAHTAAAAQEKAVSMAEAAERERCAQLAALCDSILQAFVRTGDGYRARAGQVQIRKWEAALLNLKEGQ